MPMKRATRREAKKALRKAEHDQRQAQRLLEKVQGVFPEKIRDRRERHYDDKHADQGAPQAFELIEDRVPVPLPNFIPPSHTKELYARGC